MSFSTVPKYAFRALTDVTPGFLESIGVDFLMMDLDNTIAAYGEKMPSEKLLRWASGMKAGGITLFIVSNNHRLGRVGTFGAALGAGFINKARKPSPEGVFRAMSGAGRSAENSALAGDQIFTDTIAANLAGVISIIVPPVSCKNPLFALRYALEMPFRALCKNKQWRSER